MAIPLAPEKNNIKGKLPPPRAQKAGARQEAPEWQCPSLPHEGVLEAGVLFLELLELVAGRCPI